jgi:hypothetical protein
MVRLEFAWQFLDVDVNHSFGDRRAQSALDQFGAAKHAPGLGRQDRKEPELCWRENDFAAARPNAEKLREKKKVGVHGLVSLQSDYVRA